MEKVAHNLKLFENHPHWAAVLEICTKLSGFETYLAGGSVRDLVMHKSPKDFDIATNSTPDQLMDMFPKALSVGREFGVIILPFQDFQIEIASFRSDGEYLDGRRPSSVRFTSAKEDALRRDFTVNALFLDLKTSEIIDYVGGLRDIQAKTLKAVGDPIKRFTEDKLRMMRALRFSAQLNFVIEPKTFSAIQTLQHEIKVVSPERIRDELVKLFQTQSIATGLKGLFETGLINSLHPQFAEFLTPTEQKNLEKIFFVDRSGQQLLAKLGVLFAARVSKNQADEFTKLKLLLKDLRFSSAESDKIQWILMNDFKYLGFGQMRLADQIRLIGHPNFLLLMDFIKLYRPALYDDMKSNFKKLSQKYLVEGALPAPFLSGEDLKKLGVKAGPELGEMLNLIYTRQLEQGIVSQKQALDFAKSLI